MSDVLKVKIRESRGTRDANRLRAAGQIPTVLYGHGKASVSLAVAADAMASLLRHGSRVVELTEGVQEKVLVTAVQWDTYGVDILHVDFSRVSEHERVEITVAVELVGEAPGLKQGGVVENPLHELQIECEAMAIPEKLVVRINELNLGDMVIGSQVELPLGAKLLSHADDVVVQCVEPAVHADEEEGEGSGAEPEVIGRKEDEGAGA